MRAMSRSWGERAEPVFRAWARFVVAHPFVVLLPVLAATFFCIAGLARLRMDVSFESFLKQDDPVLIAYEEFAASFGRDERIVISAEPGEPMAPKKLMARDLSTRGRTVMGRSSFTNWPS